MVINSDGTASFWYMKRIHDSGDVNHDKMIDVNDVTMLIQHILGGNADCCATCADVREDGELDVSDVTAIINLILMDE